jgi:hypothetical protein
MNGQHKLSKDLLCSVYRLQSNYSFDRRGFLVDFNHIFTGVHEYLGGDTNVIAVFGPSECDFVFVE